MPMAAREWSNPLVINNWGPQWSREGCHAAESARHAGTRVFFTPACRAAAKNSLHHALTMAFGTVLLFSLLMVACPLGTYFSAAHGRLDSLLSPLLGSQLLQDNRTVVSAVCSVLAVNAVLLAFVVTAFLESPPPPPAADRKDK